MGKTIASTPKMWNKLLPCAGADPAVQEGAVRPGPLPGAAGHRQPGGPAGHEHGACDKGGGHPEAHCPHPAAGG